MAKAPAFQWYPKDCDTDENIRLMTDSELGFFMLCLNHSWINDGLPGDTGDIARLFRRSKKQVDGYWRQVGKCFVLIDGRFRNMKQEAQRGRVREFQESRKRAAAARWENARAMHMHENSDARAMHVECSASASASASTNLFPITAVAVEKKPPRKTRMPCVELPDEWATYPADRFGWTRERALSTFEAMRLWATSKGATYVDWEAAWQGWCRREEDKKPTIREAARPINPAHIPWKDPFAHLKGLTDGTES